MMSKPDDPQKDTEAEEGSPDELLGDLESIKDLLDEQQQRTASNLPSSDDATEAGVPLLDDMIDGAYKLEERSFLTAATPALGGGRGKQKNRYMSEDLFDALLGDEWKASASDILTEARGAIEAHRNQWSPDDTDELNDALRVRIDETLSVWLRKTISERMDELHTELLRAAESVINEKINTLIEQRSADKSDHEE